MKLSNPCHPEQVRQSRTQPRDLAFRFADEKSTLMTTTIPSAKPSAYSAVDSFFADDRRLTADDGFTSPASQSLPANHPA